MGLIRSPLTYNGMILQALLKTKQQKSLNNGWLQMKVSFPQLTVLQKVIFGGVPKKKSPSVRLMYPMKMDGWETILSEKAYFQECLMLVSGSLKLSGIRWFDPG